jgi:hypothetical protein
MPLALLIGKVPDTKDGREKKAANRERRQREREIDEARRRTDEAEPPDEAESDDADEIRRAETGRAGEHSDPPSECHRRGCDEPPAFAVLERYQEETGHGAVEAEAFLCQEHTAEESPVNLDAAYPDYVFRVVPV